MSFLVSVALARWLGAAEYGTYAYLLSWVALLGMASVFGLDTTIVSRLPTYSSKAAWGQLRGLLRWANGLALGASIGMVVVVAVAGTLLAGGTPPPAGWLLAGALVPLMALSRVQQAALRGLHRAVISQVPESVLLPATILGLVVAAAWSGWAPPTAEYGLIAQALAGSLALALALWLVRRAVPSPARVVRARYEHREWLSTSGRMLLLSILGTLNARVGILVLGAVAAPQLVGQYAVAARGAGFIPLALNVTVLAMAPSIAVAYAAGQHARLQLLVRQMSRVALIGGVPFAVALILLGRSFLAIFGPGFEGAHTALAILSLGEVVNITAGPVATLLVMSGHERDAIRGLALGTTLNGGLCLILIPEWGINGAAVAAAAGLALWNIVLWRSVRRRLGIVSSVLGGDVPAARSRDA
jgi:O-antigen/teichoic acid export membrane protein